jgi:hypothetical protein
MRHALVFASVVALLLLVPEAAHACPVCFDASDENRQAFLATTVFLSLLPLGMVGGVGLWMRRRVKQLGESEDGTEDEGATTPHA